MVPHRPSRLRDRWRWWWWWKFSPRFDHERQALDRSPHLHAVTDDGTGLHWNTVYTTNALLLYAVRGVHSVPVIRCTCINGLTMTVAWQHCVDRDYANRGKSAARVVSRPWVFHWFSQCHRIHDGLRCLHNHADRLRLHLPLGRNTRGNLPSLGFYGLSWRKVLRASVQYAGLALFQSFAVYRSDKLHYSVTVYEMVGSTEGIVILPYPANCLGC